MKTCFKKNPLIHSGQTQEQRQQAALSPTYVKVDERSTEDLLIFFKKYAQFIHFYNENNLHDGDNWSKVLDTDVVYLLAEASKTNLNAISKTFSELMQGYEKGKTQNERKEYYAAIYNVLYSILVEINQFYNTIPESSAIRKEIYFEIDNYLASEFNLLIRAFRFGIDNFIFEKVHSDKILVKNYDYKFLFIYADAKPSLPFAIDEIIKNKFNYTFRKYFSSQDKAKQEIEDIKNVNKFYGTSTLTDKFDQLDYSVVSLKQLFRRIYDTYNRIVEKATYFLKAELNENAAHQGHHGLILAFLELFKIHQKEINQFTEKHFDFYLKDALQLKPIEGSPDSVHVLFEPTVDVNGYKIAAKTQLKAGKDNLGKDLVYTTNEDLILNQAKIEEVKTIFLEPNKKIYALPIANSADGLGKALAPEKPSWTAFGLDKLDDDKKIVAEIGFAVASPVLLLQEGKRNITMNFTIEKNTEIRPTDFKDYFQIYLTTPKGWVEYNLLATDTFNSTQSSFTLICNLPTEFPSIVPFDSKTMEGGFQTQYPIIRFQLKQDSDGAYEKFKNIKLSQVEIEVSVMGVKNLILQNDLGVMDSTKPFMPFGAVPKFGSTFYLGNKEVFDKQLTKLEFKMEWLGLAANADNLAEHYNYKFNNGNKNYLRVGLKKDDFQVNIWFLSNKNWEQEGNKPLPLFPLNNTITINSENNKPATETPKAATPKEISGEEVKPLNAVLPNAESNKSFSLIEFNRWDRQIYYERYNAKLKETAAINTTQSLNTDTEKGFAKFELAGPSKAFGHEVFPKIMAEQAVNLVKNTTENLELFTLPNPPHTPTLKAILLNYDATETISLSDKKQLLKGQFFTLHPFGFDEITDKNPYLLPQFKQKENNPFESALYLGINQIEPLQTLTIFFQVANGSENIQEVPSKVVWSYLSNNNEWKELDKNLIGDSSQELLQSGIVKVILPDDATNTSTIFDAKKYWLRASIKQNSSAHPRLLLVQAQAVRATFFNQQNSPNHLAQALAGGTISKLVNSDSSVKSVSQPYSSYGGRMVEDNAHFHQRISERLRHKNRAITIWDYEHLILQRFQQVYKVKCLNHTGFKEIKIEGKDEKKKVYNEDLAGSVMIVLIPDIRNRTGGDPYKPAFNRNTLNSVEQYIKGAAATPCKSIQKTLNCGFINLLIENPIYEPIAVTCDIKFKPCIDPNFYKIQLEKDLKAFLAPWVLDKNRPIDFGGSIHKSVILNFIEKLEFVDYIKDLSMKQYTTEELNGKITDIAIATDSRSILTTAETHTIHVID